MAKVTKVLVVNTSDGPLLIDGKMVAISGQLVVDKAVLPKAFYKYIDGAEQAKETEVDEPETSDDPLVVLQALAIPAIEEALPDLSLDDLQALSRLEESSAAPRSGVMKAVSVEILGRD